MVRRNITVTATVFAWTLVCCAAHAPSAYAQSCPDAETKVVSVQGSVQAKRAGQSEWTQVALNDVYCPGDTIRVDAGSRADVVLANQTATRLKENSTLVLEGVKESGGYALDLLQGAAHFLSRHGARNVEVNTPFTVAGVRGTEFSLDVDEHTTVVRVFEGNVLAANDAGSASLTSGQTAVAEKGKAPALRMEARPRDAVRWALYYPPVVYVRPGSLRGAPAKQLDESDAARRRGDLAGALKAIEGIDTRAVSDPKFYTYRASLLLAGGSPGRAGADVDRALAASRDDADALALQTVIEVVQNEKETALATARRAVAANPDSATAQIAQSYAQQAAFDLEGARASLTEAVRLEPDNALAWARLAEVRSSFGDLDGAVDAANKAAAIAPDLARTQTVLGFAYLTQVKTGEAAEAFEKAIALDSADPLPRLGKGLAQIRDGELDAGARNLEVAASLDPNSAVMRSYLGKAYFEEKRGKLDEREYETAKSLDPKDPTPWFYDAIAKQTTNRPVEALRNFEKAIELNDNRAVYRSRLLLDSDLAARSASLGRIYGDLGFQNLALVEGWNSVNTDPSNYSAHRLLADSYAALPRHELARTSELLQSQLLQPTNITPLQPRLAESNLFLISSQGPSNLSTTEFHPLFNRNQVALHTSGLVGQDDTYAGEGIVSGIQDKLSFSAGYSGYWTDGFRANNEMDDNLANVFAQYEISPKTSVQLEGRFRDRENGDLELRFLPDDFSRFSNEENRTYTGRVGLRHAFSPSSVLLASYIHSEVETHFNDFVPDPFFGDFSIDLDLDESGDTGEVQHIYRSAAPCAGGFVNGFDVTSGVGHANVRADERNRTEITGGPFPGTTITDRSPDVRHTNFYAYSHVAMPQDVTLTLGVSGDFFHEDDGVGTQNQGNPKVGLTWTPRFLSGTTLRAAAFRSLTRTLVTGQTLEPTQVAGFNQFFDDAPGTDAWRYGVAVDQKITNSLYAGVELSKRDLQVPQSVFGGTSFIVQKTDWDEYLTREYLFWTPHEWLATRVGHEYEEMLRDPDALFAFHKVETHRVPVGLEFFHPCGASMSFGATYLHQEGEFLRNSTAAFQSGDRDFWVLDAGVRYRLPNRYGFVSVGVNNFLDEDATYQSTDVRNPSLRPSRFAYLAVTLALP